MGTLLTTNLLKILELHGSFPALYLERFPHCVSVMKSRLCHTLTLMFSISFEVKTEPLNNSETVTTTGDASLESYAGSGKAHHISQLAET